MDERRHAGDDDQHDRSERIDTQFPVKRQIAGLHPCHHGLHISGFTAAQKTDEDRPAQERGDKQPCGCDRLGRQRPNEALSQACDERSQKRQENDDMNCSHWMLPLHPVDIINGYGSTATEIDNQYGKANRGLAGSDSQHEHRENLPRQVAQKHTERDEVDNYRQ